MNHNGKVDRCLIVMTAALAVLTAGVLLWGRLTAGRTPAERLPAVPAQSAHDGGVPHQRARIDDYITRVAKEDTAEALAAGLNAREETLLSVSYLSQEGVPETMFEVCLANRRLARLYELLKTRDDADAVCRQLFEDKLGILRSRLLESLEWLDKHRGPQRIEDIPKEELIPATDFEDNTALSAALFLSAGFCPIDETLRQLDAWHSLGTEILHSFDARSPSWGPNDGVEGSRAFLEDHAFPQSRYQLSLLASMLLRRFGINPGGTDASDTETMQARARRMAQGEPLTFDMSHPAPEFLSYARLPLCRWDATTNALDFTHVMRGVPVDDRETLGEFLVYQSWSALNPGKEREDVLKALREALLQADRERRAPGKVD